jgi:2-polyprenyl-3-methyl-5-hydroxy-6-metoxy-1,4-benzoquinol methylase
MKEQDKLKCGVRQVGKKLKQIAPNHTARYRWAIEELKNLLPVGSRILDAAGGCGYGSYMLAEAGFIVDMVDCSSDAVEWGRTHFAHEGLTFRVDDLPFSSIPDCYDAVVTLETIEHIEDAQAWIGQIAIMTSIVIGTVPNQVVVPFDKKMHKWHFRHYTVKEVQNLMEGWNVKSWATQFEKWDEEKAKMRPGQDGMTLGFVAVKP